MGVFEGVLEFRDCAVSAKSGNVFIFIVETDRFENKVRKRGRENWEGEKDDNGLEIRIFSLFRQI